MQTTEDKRENQVRSLLLSPNAILKLIGAFIIWKIVGLILGFALNIGIFVIFVVIFFATLWLSPYWQPAYSVIYRIIGNNNISPNLEQGHFSFYSWRSILFGIRFAFLAYILYLGIKMILQ